MDLAGQTPRGLMGFEPRSVMGASRVAVQSPVFARCRGLVFVPEYDPTSLVIIHRLS